VPIGRTLGHDAALLVRDPSGQVYLAWDGHRLRLPATSTAALLGYAAAQPHPVAWAWLNALPAGSDVTPPVVPDRGLPGPAIDGRPTIAGQVLKVSGGVGPDGEYFAVRTDGLVPLTPVAAALLLGDGAAAKSYPGRAVAALPLSTPGLAAAPRSRDGLVNPDLPASPPQLADLVSGNVPCVGITMNHVNGPAVQVGLDRDPLTANPAGAGDAKAASASTDPLLADRVVVQGGAGLLIRDQPAPKAPDGSVYLLVDNGVRYPIPTTEAAQALGYDRAAPAPVPGVLLRLVPVGPPLDPVAARASLPAAGTSGGTG
jgi:type VII secretion protein EccB